MSVCVWEEIWSECVCVCVCVCEGLVQEMLLPVVVEGVYVGVQHHSWSM